MSIDLATLRWTHELQEWCCVALCRVAFWDIDMSIERGTHIPSILAAIMVTLLHDPQFIRWQLVVEAVV